MMHISDYERGRMDGAHDVRTGAYPRMVPVTSEPLSAAYRDGYARGAMDAKVEGDRISKEMLAAAIAKAQEEGLRVWSRNPTRHAAACLGLS